MFNKTSLVPKLRAPVNLEIMLLSSALTAVLLGNFLVADSAVPQVHIFEVLAGGLVMFVAAFVCLSFFGRYIDAAAAVLAGMGFGILVNDLGQFISINDPGLLDEVIPGIYFFFIFCFFLARYFLSSRKPSPNDYLVNSLEVIQDDFVTEKYKESYEPADFLLKKAGRKNPVVKLLHHLVHAHLDIAPKKERNNPWLAKIRTLYPEMAEKKLLKIILIAFFSLFGAFNAWFFLSPLLDGFSWDLTSYSWFEMLEFFSSVLIILATLGGFIELFYSKRRAFRLLELSVYFSIFLEQVFIYDSNPNIGTIGLAWSLAALFLIKSLIYLEERHMHLHVLGRINKEPETRDRQTKGNAQHA